MEAFLSQFGKSVPLKPIAQSLTGLSVKVIDAGSPQNGDFGQISGVSYSFRSPYDFCVMVEFVNGESDYFSIDNVLIDKGQSAMPVGAWMQQRFEGQFELLPAREG